MVHEGELAARGVEGQRVDEVAAVDDDRLTQAEGRAPQVAPGRRALDLLHGVLVDDLHRRTSASDRSGDDDDDEDQDGTLLHALR